jgi:hypothetical protein
MERRVALQFMLCNDRGHADEDEELLAYEVKQGGVQRS